MNRRTIALIVGIAAPMLFMLAACGDDPTSTAAGTPSATPTPLTEAQLKPLLLTADDMPAGFDAENSDDDSAYEPVGCAAVDKLMTGTEDGVDNAVDLSREADSAYLSETISVLSDPDPAAEFTEAKDAFATCKSMSLSNPDGTALKLPVTPLDAPVLGDDSFAFTATASDGGMKMIIQSMFVLVGDKVIEVDNMAVGTIDDALTTETITSAVNKVKADSKTA